MSTVTMATLSEVSPVYFIHLLTKFFLLIVQLKSDLFSKGNENRYVLK